MYIWNNDFFFQYSNNSSDESLSDSDEKICTTRLNKTIGDTLILNDDKKNGPR